MADIVISYKVFPTGIEVDFDDLQKRIAAGLPQKTVLYGDNQTEPIAFGLNALIIHVKIPEDETGILEKVEQSIEEIPTVSRIQTLIVRRTR